MFKNRLYICGEARPRHRSILVWEQAGSYIQESRRNIGHSIKASHLQYSVFRCELSRKDLAELGAGLQEIINHSEEQVLFFDLGPHEGRARKAVDFVGLPYTHPERHAFVF